ncbi:MAG: hypothetical protein HUK09_09230 [Bacteroidaceae bacterium]|nr:hypothetical protein [Bacteroidaceae bacterium]
MQSYLQRLLIYICCLVCSSSMMGQRVLRPVKSAIKAKKYADAFAQIEKLRKDSAAAMLPQLYVLGVETAQHLNDLENEKIYLKRKPDTLAYFRTLYNIFDYALLSDSIGRQQEWKRLTKTRKEHAELLHPLLINLNAATTYFLSKSKYEDLEKYTMLGLRLNQAKLLDEVGGVPQSYRKLWAERNMLANYQLQRFGDALRFQHLALQDSTHREAIIETMVLSQFQLGDTAKVVQLLRSGVDEFPNNTFFFTRLADTYLVQSLPDRIPPLVQRILPYSHRPVVLLEYEAKAYDEMQMDSLCLSTATKILELDSLNATADYYVSKSLLSLANKIELPTSINAPNYKKAFKQQQQLYKRARPHAEQLRAVMPNATTLWKPLLYEIYLKLNLGKEFDEISKQK